MARSIRRVHFIIWGADFGCQTSGGVLYGTIQDSTPHSAPRTSPKIIKAGQRQDYGVGLELPDREMTGRGQEGEVGRNSKGAP